MIHSVRGRVWLLFAACILLLSTSVAVSLVANRVQAQDALTINVAGRQRLLLQRMTTDVLLLVGSGDGARAFSVSDSAAAFGAALHALRSGGQVLSSDGRLVDLPPPPRSEISAGLQHLAADWTTFQVHLRVVTSTAPESTTNRASVAALESLAPALVSEADLITRLYELDATRKVSRLRTIQVAFFGGAFLLLVVGLLLVQTSAVKPLAELRAVARRIGDGDLASRVETRGAREIVELAQALDTIRAHLATAAMGRAGHDAAARCNPCALTGVRTTGSTGSEGGRKL